MNLFFVFKSNCFTLIETPRNSRVWLKTIRSAVDYTHESKCSSLSEKSIVVIPVHGIRTFGNWYDHNKSFFEVNCSHVEVCSYKYGYFSLLSLVVPLARSYHVNLFKRNFENVMASRENRRVVIISHSFGTYIVAKTLELLVKENSSIKIDLIIFSGSVLKSNYNLMCLHKIANKIINDCGIDDKVLCLSQLFVPGCGMAGRVGFFSIDSEKFFNRYFSGGHSLYFEHSSKFIEKFWIPAILGDENYYESSTRKPNFYEPFLECVGYVKDPIAYMFLAFVLFFLARFLYSTFI